MPCKVLENVFKRYDRLALPFFEGCKVGCVLGEGQTDGFVNKLGQASGSGGRFYSQRLVHKRVKINRCAFSFCCHDCISFGDTVAFGR